MRLVPLLLLLLSAPVHAEWLVLLDTTDRHGHLETREGKGGAALLGGYLANARAAAPGRVLLVDSGDMFQGTMVSNLSEGAAVVRALNALGYDAAAVGNHEFDYGPVGENAVPKSPKEDPLGALKARAAEAKFPLLSANVSGKNLPWKSWHLTQVGGVKVAIVGGTSEDLFRTTIKPNLVGLRVEPLVASVSRAAAEARKAGAQVVVVAVHAGGSCPHRKSALTSEEPGDLSGCEDGSELFRLARGLQARAKNGEGGKVDALFGGHTHKALTAVVDGLPVAQPHASGMELAEIAIEIEKGKPTGRFRVEPATTIRADGVYKGKPVTADEKVAATFTADLARAAEKRAAPVGVRLEGGLHRAFARESPLGNLVADLMRQAAGADFGLTNGGGLRADLPDGPLTYGALFEALPFDNRLATVEIEGVALRRMLRKNLESDRGILSISGARVSARCAEKGLVVDVLTDGGKPLEDGRRYRVATSDFLALGGDDFGAVASQMQPRIDDNLILRDLVAEKLAKLAKDGVLRGDDPRFWNPAQRRMDLPMPRPVRCHSK
jgi:5'-nucleotidase